MHQFISNFSKLNLLVTATLAIFVVISVVAIFNFLLLLQECLVQMMCTLFGSYHLFMLLKKYFILKSYRENTYLYIYNL